MKINISITDDDGNDVIIWQNHSFNSADGTTRTNYSIEISSGAKYPNFSITSFRDFICSSDSLFGFAVSNFIRLIGTFLISNSLTVKLVSPVQIVSLLYPL